MRAHDGAGGKAFILWSMLPCYIPVDWPIALMAVLMEKVMGVVEGVRGRRARGKGMSTTPRGASVPGYLKGRGWKVVKEGRVGSSSTNCPPRYKANWHKVQPIPVVIREETTHRPTTTTPTHTLLGRARGLGCHHGYRQQTASAESRWCQTAHCWLPSPVCSVSYAQTRRVT